MQYGFIEIIRVSKAFKSLKISHERIIYSNDVDDVQKIAYANLRGQVNS